MKVTRTWIATNFEKFNKEYFNNVLPTPNFIISQSYRQLGLCQVRGANRPNPYYAIKISNHFERSEKEYQNTLIHEMIHLYFFSKKELKVNHGWKFQQMARSFDKYGWNIHTKEENFHGKTSGGTIPTRYVISFYDSNDGKVWVCCVANDTKKQKTFLNILNRNQRYSEIETFCTNSDKFSCFKISHTRLGGKTMSRETFNEEWLPLMKATTF